MTVDQFFKLTDEDEILKAKAIKDAIKGRDHIGKYKSKKFIDYSYKKVQTIKDYYQEGNIPYLVSYTCNMGHRELMKRPYQELMYYLKFCEEQLEGIQKLEARLNEKNADEEEEQMKMEMAGKDYETLGSLGMVNLVDSLAVERGVEWDVIENYKFSKVFVILLRSKLKARVQRTVAKQKSKKE